MLGGMSSPSRYPIPGTIHRVEQLIDRSRFIATVAPAATVDEAQAFVRATSAEFADATHNCWAYVVGAPGSTGRVGMSDDGEPHGTAGRPMLTVLLHSGIGDVAAVVTRYYGGIKLGTGGLARAYGGTLQEALASLPRTERVTLVRLDATVDYGAINAMQMLLPAHEGVAEQVEYGAEVRYRVALPDTRVAAFEDALREATSGRARVEVVTER